MKEENIKIKINVSKIYPEVIFYINWAKKSKNKKVKRRLAIKALKEFKHLSNEELKERVKQNISFRCDNCEYEFGTEEAKLDYE